MAFIVHGFTPSSETYKQGHFQRQRSGPALKSDNNTDGSYLEGFNTRALGDRPLDTLLVTILFVKIRHQCFGGQH